MLIYDIAAGRFARSSRVDPAMIPGRRYAADLTATLNELVALLGPPDTGDDRFPCWLIRRGNDGPVLSVYHPTMNPQRDPGRKFRFSVGAQRPDAGLALLLTSDIVTALDQSAVLCEGGEQPCAHVLNGS